MCFILGKTSQFANWPQKMNITSRLSKNVYMLPGKVNCHISLTSGASIQRSGNLCGTCLLVNRHCSTLTSYAGLLWGSIKWKPTISFTAVGIIKSHMHFSYDVLRLEEQED